MNQFWDCSHSLCVGGIGSCHMVSGTVNVWCWFIPLRWGLSPCRSSCNGCTTLPSLALSSRTAGVNAQIAAWSRVYQDHTRNSLVQSLNHLLLIIGDGSIEMKLRRDAAGHLYNIDTTVYTFTCPYKVRACFWCTRVQAAIWLARIIWAGEGNQGIGPKIPDSPSLGCQPSTHKRKVWLHWHSCRVGGVNA